MRIPLLPVTLSFMIGVVLGDACPVVSWPGLPLLALVAVIAIAAMHSSLEAATVGLVVLFGALGAIAMAPGSGRSELALRALDSERPVVFEGRVDTATRSERGGTADLEITARCDTSPCEPAAGRVRLSFAGPPPPPGEVIRFRSRLDRIEGAGNPGARDPRDEARREGIDRRGVVSDHGWILMHRDARLSPSLSPLTRALEHLVTARERLRNHLRGFYQQNGRPETTGILLGLSLGERSSIDGEVKADFARSGLAHLLAISGSHFALVAVGAEAALRALLLMLPGLNKRLPVMGLAALGAAATILLYSLLIGITPSIGRALLMGLLALTLRGASRQVMPGGVLTLAGLGVLVCEPTALWDVGCQLSFASVTALITLTPRLRQLGADGLALLRPGPTVAPPLFSWVPSQLGALLSTSAAATLGTAPLCAYYFGNIAVVGIVANVIGIPLLGACCLPFVLGAGALELAGLPGALSTLELAEQTILLGIRVADFFGDPARIPQWDTSFTLLQSVLLGAVILCWLLPARVRTTAAALAGLLLALTFLPGSIEGADPPSLRMVQLNVGQGDSTVLTLPDGRVVVIDGGGGWSGRGRGFDPGRSILLPYLKATGHSRVDLMVLSHPHPDHLGGLAGLARLMPVDALWVGELPTRGGEFKDFLDGLAARGTRISVIDATTPLPTLAGVRFRCLHPAPGWQTHLRRRKDRSVNNGSLVIEASYGDIDILLTGDIERQIELDGAQAGTWPRVEIVKVPHHGSETSSTPGLVAATRPAAVLIGVGRDNRFGFPRREVVRRWAVAGARVYRTDQDGAIELDIRQDGFDVRMLGRSPGRVDQFSAWDSPGPRVAAGSGWYRE